MFEKEAEEYRIKAFATDKDYESIATHWRNGAEFGYNKVKEWHYVKDELPPENIPLNIITFDKNKKRRLWEGEYKGLNGKCWTGYFNPYIDIPYAWKEIVLPELPEEN